MFSIYRNHMAMAALKETWENADSTLREAILSASRRLDQQLHIDPHEQGESREDNTRILFDAPLGVLFEVDESKKLVHILRAWAFPTGFDRRGLN